MKNSLLIVLLALVMQSCSKYGNVSLKYPTAPAAVLPEGIHTLAMVNRSLVKKDDHNAVIESVISGEVAGSDKLASDDCLKGVFDRINGWRDISVVIPAHTRLYGTGTRETPELLDWGTVKRICDSTHADALLVLETFDSNSNLLANVVSNGVNAVVNGTPATPVRQIRVNVLCYWRLYDPVNQRIIDQYQSSSYMTFDAGNALVPVPPPDGLSRVAYQAGETYISRFLPTYYYVRREMYKRGKGRDKQQFLAAFRHSEVADWEGALPIWMELAKSHNRTNAGRACLDIAVTYEVLGKTNDALTWARKAYEDYGNKLARDYQKELSYRLRMEY